MTEGVERFKQANDGVLKHDRTKMKSAFRNRVLEILFLLFIQSQHLDNGVIQ